MLARQAASLLTLLLAVLTLLFFLLRATADQALVLAGPEATPEQIAAIRAEYGLDQPLYRQYLGYLGNVARLDFGESLVSSRPALDEVLDKLPNTLLIAALALVVTIAISVPLGAWLGRQPPSRAQRAVGGVVFVLQGTPGFVIALLLIAVFAVELRWLPFVGNEGWRSWIMPTLTLASFLFPKLSRVIAANVSEALEEDYIRTARANGASEPEVLWRHALPNALLGATALVGSQLAFLLSGSVITETIFAWPGIGTLLIKSTQNADFNVVQAVACVIAVLVFVVNALADTAFRWLDPRLRARQVAP